MTPVSPRSNSRFPLLSLAVYGFPSGFSVLAQLILTTLTIYSVLYSFDIRSTIALKTSFTPCLSLRFGLYLESQESPQKLKFLPASARCSLGAHALCAPILRLLFRNQPPYIRCRLNLVLSSALMRIPTLRILRIAHNNYQIPINVKKNESHPHSCPGMSPDLVFSYFSPFWHVSTQSVKKT